MVDYKSCGQGVKEEEKKVEEAIEKEEEKAEVGELTESDLVEIANMLRRALKMIEDLPTEKKWAFIEKLRPYIQELVEQGGYTEIPELWEAIYWYKSIALPLSAYKGSMREYSFLKKVKCPVEYVYSI